MTIFFSFFLKLMTQLTSVCIFLYTHRINDQRIKHRRFLQFVFFLVCKMKHDILNVVGFTIFPHILQDQIHRRNNLWRNERVSLTTFHNTGCRVKSYTPFLHSKLLSLGLSSFQ